MFSRFKQKGNKIFITRGFDGNFFFTQKMFF